MAQQDNPEAESTKFNRRTVLSSLGVGAVGTVAGIGAFSGSARASSVGADFKGCSEVWIIITDKTDQTALTENGFNDVFDGPNDKYPQIVDVIVADGDDVECRCVELTEETVTTIPGKYGDTPLVKYRVSDGEKILAIIKNSPSRIPLDCNLRVNDHRCAENAPSYTEADCYKCRRPCSGQDFEPEPCEDFLAKQKSRSCLDSPVDDD